MFKNGDKVKGIFSGKYLGEIEIVSKDGENVWIRAPDGSLTSMSPLLIAEVPDLTDAGIARVWVGS